MGPTLGPRNTGGPRWGRGEITVIEVWGRRNSSNVVPVMWTLGELDLPASRRDVGGSFGGLDTPDFRAMNPNGKIPVIKDRDLVLWESQAIIRYLCQRYGKGSLLPDTPGEQALADQWMEWYKTAVYPLYIQVLWATVRTEPKMRDLGKINAATAALGEVLAVLDQHLAGRAFLVADRLTMADIPIGAALYRYFNLAIERPALPRLADWFATLEQRPAYRRHVAFPFGTKPAEWYLLERDGAG